MNRHPLDRPIWSALTGRHAALADGDALARRYDPAVSAFAAARDDSPPALLALATLAKPGSGLLLLQADAVVVPSGLVAVSTAEAVQMIAEQPATIEHDDRIEQLGASDIPAMQALADLTKPGPFTPRALDLGSFWGVKIDGRLAAMAGERLKPDGFTEISGVCSHPEARGQGLARLLSMYVAGRILERSEVPFLHAYATNQAAIRLYETIGFRLRSAMHVAVLERG
ncbi:MULTISPECIES: GNAT family N-acetyltransferase [Phyllobacteriaceae]|jgi:predicted GNAT family acetyltransferase|uniref:GNAT family N-acetyltransferase n=1 Tax=Mesorhizobium hungaricum TaxID=1566387 RepID=A0A1C2DJP8_9HYPH|nr:MULTISPECIES: GNAT family N-acetyltransferase [Mesorhizobium]MBN9233301.1 GNAT family N-acetyltransferase [Mesorhizobium sp.]MDQ0332010.1 putative GNAT family acetyltransferase [Mesorhizobium sp. YL-MeA3-2017]OCX14893.1 GNAT family N-acetyltransferase [Mesorhizobium hungaricum]